MQGKRKTVAILVLSLLFLVSLSSCQGSQDQTGSGYEEGLERVMAFYQHEVSELQSWWEMVALYGAGADLESGPWRLPSWTPEDVDHNSAATSYAGYILGLLAQGENPWEWQGRNLPAELASLQHKEGYFEGSINHTIWAMLALDVAGFSYSKEDALAYLLGEQKEDGGYALTGSTGDPDVTAMALMALRFHRDQPEVEAAIEGSLAFLEDAMFPSGGYASFNAENANSTAIVLSALIALGEDIQGAPWQQEDKSPLEALLAYQLPEGSFSFFLEPLVEDTMSTYQALLALGDVSASTSVFTRLQVEGELYRQKTAQLQQAEPPEATPAPAALKEGAEIVLTSNYPGARIFYTFDEGDPLEAGEEYTQPITLERPATLRAAVRVLGMKESQTASFEYSIEEVVQEEKPVERKLSSDTSGTETQPKEEPKPEAPTISVTLRVVGESKTYFNGIVKVPLDKANALQALLETNLKVSLLYNNNYVSSVEGEKAHGVSGWKYKVNSVETSTPAIDNKVKNGDTIIWWFADTPDSTGP